jgi:hypothetical protein
MASFRVARPNTNDNARRRSLTARANAFKAAVVAVLLPHHHPCLPACVIIVLFIRPGVLQSLSAESHSGTLANTSTYRVETLKLDVRERESARRKTHATALSMATCLVYIGAAEIIDKACDVKRGPSTALKGVRRILNRERCDWLMQPAQRASQNCCIPSKF